MRKTFLLTVMLVCLSVLSWAQVSKITGTVTGESGAAVQGASITLRGSSRGTVTDADGSFTLDVSGLVRPVLVINSIGFAEQEVPVGNNSVFRIKLITQDKALEDVVVVGYGQVRKKDLTGAVGSLSPRDIVRANPSNATAALQGQVTGVVITKASNKPGQDYKIDIRGQNTITGATEPLVVVDGVIGARMRDINPADIQSIDVLKDASSTAIYGARGANGVIIITSKKGVSGKPKVTIDSYYGSKRPAHLPRLQTA